MKRFILLMMVVLLVTWAVRAAHRGRPPWPKYEPGGWSTHDIHDRYRAAYYDHDVDRRDPHGAMGEVRVALHEARKEIRDAWKEVRREVGEAYREVRESISHEERILVPPVPPVPPVPAFPAMPPAPPRSIAARIEPQRNIDVKERFRKASHDADAESGSAAEESAAIRMSGNAPVTGYELFEPVSGSKDVSKLTGRISATEERARADARRALAVAVRDWLGPNVSSSWTPPDRLVDSMILSVHTEPVIKGLRHSVHRRFPGGHVVEASRDPGQRLQPRNRAGIVYWPWAELWRSSSPAWPRLRDMYGPMKPPRVITPTACERWLPLPSAQRGL